MNLYYLFRIEKGAARLPVPPFPQALAAPYLEISMMFCRFPILAAVCAATAVLAMDPPAKDHKSHADTPAHAAHGAAPAPVFEEIHDAALAKAMAALEGLELSGTAEYTNETGAPLTLALEAVSDNQSGLLVALVDGDSETPVLLSSSGRRWLALPHGKTITLAVAAKPNEKMVNKSLAIALKGAKWGSLQLKVGQDGDLTLAVA